jgi:hypothetical protein
MPFLECLTGVHARGSIILLLPSTTIFPMSHPLIPESLADCYLLHFERLIVIFDGRRSELNDFVLPPKKQIYPPSSPSPLISLIHCPARSPELIVIFLKVFLSLEALAATSSNVIIVTVSPQRLCRWDGFRHATPSPPSFPCPLT